MATPNAASGCAALGHRDALGREPRDRADAHVLPLDVGARARARCREKLRDVRDFEASLDGLGDDGLAHGMLAATLHRSREPEDQLNVGFGDRREADDHRLALGERSRFVDGDSVHVREPLERVARAHQHAELRGAAERRRNRGGRREPERARARHHHDGDERGERVDELRLRAEDPPGERRSRREHHDARGEPRCDAVREPLDRSARRLRVLDERSDARDACVLPVRSARTFKRPSIVSVPA